MPPPASGRSPAQPFRAQPENHGDDAPPSRANGHPSDIGYLPKQDASPAAFLRNILARAMRPLYFGLHELGLLHSPNNSANSLALGGARSLSPPRQRIAPRRRCD